MVLVLGLGALARAVTVVDASYCGSSKAQPYTLSGGLYLVAYLLGPIYSASSYMHSTFQRTATTTTSIKTPYTSNLRYFSSLAGIAQREQTRQNKFFQPFDKESRDAFAYRVVVEVSIWPVQRFAKGKQKACSNLRSNLRYRWPELMGAEPARRGGRRNAMLSMLWPT